ncbi:hypothetical protein Mal4_21290 [Maioricimonas rarisocia]|uniref:Uncharacterized protein n=1 Tax=Maioricimonas rarisocia TaxID=2528026 RepID=A0A517Z5N7_9PLAN|nr:hypothetical protein Mal4_21290 [Maioricimonas rarisocia]
MTRSWSASRWKSSGVSSQGTPETRVPRKEKWGGHSCPPVHQEHRKPTSCDRWAFALNIHREPCSPSQGEHAAGMLLGRRCAPTASHPSQLLRWGRHSCLPDHSFAFRAGIAARAGGSAALRPPATHHSCSGGADIPVCLITRLRFVLVLPRRLRPPPHLQRAGSVSRVLPCWLWAATDAGGCRRRRRTVHVMVGRPLCLVVRHGQSVVWRRVPDRGRTGSPAVTHPASCLVDWSNEVGEVGRVLRSAAGFASADTVTSVRELPPLVDRSLRYLW